MLGNFSWQNLKSFVWPAILGPYWFAYRKLYKATALIVATMVLTWFLPSRYTNLCGFALALACLYFGPAIYLCHIRDAVAAIKEAPDEQSASALVLGRGGNSWAAAIVLIIAIFGSAAIVEVFPDGIDGLSLSDLALPFQQSNVSLRVETSSILPGLFSVDVTNTGHAPITVRSIVVNGRSECTHNLMIQNLFPGSEWESRLLNVGDVTRVVSACRVIRAQIETDRGAAVYTFSE